RRPATSGLNPRASAAGFVEGCARAEFSIHAPAAGRASSTATKRSSFMINPFGNGLAEPATFRPRRQALRATWQAIVVDCCGPLCKAMPKTLGKRAEKGKAFFLVPFGSGGYADGCHAIAV